ncbi:hypothetical protein [Magnetospirillum molischianum]|uniref:Uncharacterized protein n=1 Tax=Magnetospirillum molischianum DSM 120 TaxID=1150626 RepID=H8FP81_MAGML|nr:hypothetical protein [Magnetospirillum molischianum]CCG40169.1 hypothetical protein PHAMO_180138 [Magnetospirillum molischianum DSM 120]
MPERIDNASIVAALTAPAWVPVLSTINVVLSFVSIVLGLAFLAWRWHRAVRSTPGREV